VIGERSRDDPVGECRSAESWNEGDRDPDTGELDQRAEIGILGDHARHRAEVGEDAHERLMADRPLRRARPRVVDEVGAFDRLVAGERMRRGQDDVGLIAAQMLGDDMARRDKRHRVPVVHDCQIGGARRHHPHRVDRVDARDRRVHRGIRIPQFPQHRAQESPCRGGEGGDAERCRRAGSARGECLQPLKAVEQLAPLTRERAPPLGEEHTTPPPLEEGGVEVALELLHLLGDGRWRVPESTGGRDDGAGTVDGDERTKALQIDHEVIVRCVVNNSELVLHRCRCEAEYVTPRHLVLGLLVALIWGVNFVAIDLGLRDTLPLVLVALRFALVAVPLVFLVPKPDAPWRVIVGIGLFMSAGQFGLLFTAMHLGLPAGLAAVILQCQMIFTLIIGVIVLRERPTRMQLVGALVGVAGLAVVAVGRLEGAAGFGAIVPLLFCVAAGLSWGIGNVISRSAAGTDGFGIVVWSALVVPVPVLALSLVLDGPAAVVDAFATIGWQTIASVAYTAGLASLVGYTIWNMLLGRYPAALVAPFALLTPPIGLAAAAIALGQVPNTLELIGSALLVGGVAVGQLRRRARDAMIAPTARPQHGHMRRPARPRTLRT
jgi:O-acetylserine/cysteine efflux transporter